MFATYDTVDLGIDVQGPPVEEQLAQLAAAAGPLRHAMALVAARLLDTRAYERLCYARVRDYARERPGLSARQLQELARVGRALRERPRLEAALLANRLPWSKVRLLARVVTASDEEAWIARARVLDVRALGRVLREHVRCRDEGESAEETEELRAPEPTRQVRIRCTPAVAEQWGATREFAERVAARRLSAADAFELVVAEVYSEVGIDPVFAAQQEPRGPARVRGSAEGPPLREGGLPASPREPATEVPRAVAALTAGLEEADAFALDRRLRRAVHLEQTLDARMAPLLRVVSYGEYEWRGPHYLPLSHYAPESLGMSASKARALLRLERVGDVCPELRRAYRRGRLSWLKARCLAPLLGLDLDGHWRPRWVAWAERVTLRRLERDVERALLLRAGHIQAWQRCQDDPARAQDPIPEAERSMCAPDVDLEATQELVFRVSREVAALYEGVRDTLRARLRRRAEERAREGRGAPPRHFPHDGEVFAALLDGAMAAWQQRDPTAGRPDPVLERDDYRCAVPGCTSRASFHDHHVHYRGRGGSDELWNRSLLCVFHHQRCVHPGLLRISGRAPDRLVFELGLRADGPPLARYRSGDIRLPRIARLSGVAGARTTRAA